MFTLSDPFWTLLYLLLLLVDSCCIINSETGIEGPRSTMRRSTSKALGTLQLAEWNLCRLDLWRRRPVTLPFVDQYQKLVEDDLLQRMDFTNESNAFPILPNAPKKKLRFLAFDVCGFFPIRFESRGSSSIAIAE